MPEPRRALVTGVTGQDGSYLAECLMNKGWMVFGGVRRSAVEIEAQRYSRINHLIGHHQFRLVPLDVTCLENCLSTVATVSPDHIYHLAANSFVADSFGTEHDVLRVNEGGTLNMLRAMRDCAPKSRFYFAGTSEQFGDSAEHEYPQDETTPMRPKSPYGISKLAAYHMCRYYRDVHGMFVSCGLLFNHESPRRGSQFVTRKITLGVAELAMWRENHKIPFLRLGNLDAKRDWGYAPDYVRGMHLMLEEDDPDDYVLATGKTFSIRCFLEAAFHCASSWGGVLFDGMTPTDCVSSYVKVDEEFKRPNDVLVLKGNPTKAMSQFGWVPSVSFLDMVKMMVEHDIMALRCGVYRTDIPQWKEVVE